MSFQIFLLLGSFLLLALAARLLVSSLTRLARFLQWREFVLVFFVIGIGGALPNLFVGISSALRGIPELSFADVMGNNVIVFTVVAGLAALLGRELSVESRVVSQSTQFLFMAAILPLLLILDGTLGRGDAIVLLLMFFLYSFWLLSKRKLFETTIETSKSTRSLFWRFAAFLKSLLGIAVGIPLLVLGADGLVRSSAFFAETLGVPLPLVGLFVVAIGTSLPELFFSTIAARKGNSWLALGEIMGSVIILSTLVLGVVALIEPIKIPDLSPLAIARLFLLVSTLFFLIFTRTGKKISRAEGIFLLFLYLAFVAAELFTKLWCNPELTYCQKVITLNL